MKKPVLIVCLAVLLIFGVLVASLWLGSKTASLEFRVLSESVLHDGVLATLIHQRRPARFIARSGRDYGIDLYLVNPRDFSRRVIPVLDRVSAYDAASNAKWLGHDGRHLWLWANLLEGFDLITGQKITFENILAANPQTQGQYILDPQYFQLDWLTNQLRFRLKNGREVTLDPQTLKLSPFSEEARTASKEYYRLYHERIPMTGDAVDRIRWVSAPGLALLTEKQAADRDIPGPQANIHNVSRRLFRAPGEFLSLGDTEYIEGAFLRHPSKPSALPLTNPDGFLIVHRSQIGRDGNWFFTRIDSNGKRVWHRETSLTGIDQILSQPDYTIILSPGLNISRIDHANGNISETKIP